MHTKFGLNPVDFDKMVEEERYSELAAKLKETLEKGKIREGDYESGMDWLRKSAQMKGKTI